MEIETVSQTQIACSPQEAYGFVTQPRNWVGTHPVTAAVKGAPEGSAGPGEHWVETIQGPGMPAFDVEWGVIAAELPSFWEIRCAKLGPIGAEVTITYRFTAEGNGKLFHRRMVSRFASDAAPPPEIREALRNSAVHDLYLEAVKQRLEAAAASASAREA
jgi:hypothetical protein